MEHEYDDACGRCEFVIALTPEVRQVILDVGKLRYDRRQSGSRGRSLEHPIPALGLLRDDRLEPCLDLPDVGKFEEVDLSTIKYIIFWRPSRETMTRHRNPLFNAEIGITVWRTLTPDSLHTLYLGVFHSLCKLIVWKLILSGAWGGHGTQEEAVEIAILTFRNALSNWYKKRAKAYPRESLTRISDITKKMNGDPSDQRLKTKGAETWGLLCFLVDELPHHIWKLGLEGGRLLEAATALKDTAVLFDTNGIQLQDASGQLSG